MSDDGSKMAKQAVDAVNEALLAAAELPPPTTPNIKTEDIDASPAAATAMVVGIENGLQTTPYQVAVDLQSTNPISVSTPQQQHQQQAGVDLKQPPPAATTNEERPLRPEKAEVAATTLIDPTKVVECNEKDVLMGRGKRVSEWPGNIAFRAIVQQYRSLYLGSARHRKVQVARQVIEEVERLGGRFLRELEPSNGLVDQSKWLPIEHSRVVEKTCQALREKGKVRTPNGVIKKRPHENITKDNTDDAMERLAAHRNKFLRTNAHYNITTDPSPPWVMLSRLESFLIRFGHTAVPPRWEEDAQLADWCSVQRQVFADLQVGKLVERTDDPAAGSVAAAAAPEATAKSTTDDEAVAEAIPPTNEKDPEQGTVSGKTPAETEGSLQVQGGADKLLSDEEAIVATTLSPAQQHVLNELRRMNFIVDYDEWHWNSCFEKMQAEGAGLYRAWIVNQKRNHREGTLREDRLRKLVATGVAFMN